MPKFLRKKEFEKVIKALWSKSKEKFVEDIVFDETIDAATNKPKNTLSKTKNGQTTEVIDHVVTEWMDLDYTTQSSIKNIFDKNTQVENDKRYYFSNIENYAGCKIVKIPCKTNDEFTIIKGASHDSSQVGIYNANGTHLRQLNVNHNNVNGKEVYRFTIPSDLQDASYFVTSMYENHVDINKVMVFKENVANNNIPTNYVPFTDGATVLIDSSEVALSFDSTDTSLSSITIHSAIKELDKRVFTTKWQDLDYVYDVDGLNVFDAKNLKYGKYFNGITTGLVDSDEYAYYTFDCKSGDQFTVIKTNHDSDTFAFLDTNGAVLQNLTVNAREANGRKYYQVTVPTNTAIVKAGFNIHLKTNKTSEVELHKSHVEPTSEFIPNTNGAGIIVDGTEVSIGFDPMDSGLSSTTVESAIRETLQLTNLNLDNKVDRSEVGNEAGKIPTIGADGKLPEILMPSIAITKIIDVADEAEALNKSSNNEIQTGDFVRVASNQNKIYIHREAQVGNFETRFVELTSGTVKSVNGIQPDADGDVEIGIENVEYLVDVLKYFEKDKASLSKDNVFVGKNTFNELELTGKTVFTQTGGAPSNSYSTVDKYSGYRSVSTHNGNNSTPLQPVYVSAVKIEVADSLNVGDSVDGVYVVEMEKKTRKAVDIVGDTFADNSSFVVEEDSNNRKVIYVPIEKTYTVDTYFLIGKNGRQELAETFYADANDVTNNSINGLDITSLPTKGSELGHDRGLGWVVRHALTTDTMNVREELESLKNKFANAGTVSSVNNQSPVQGNITLDGTHIKLDGQNSQTVKQEIDTLKGRVDNCVTMVNGQRPISGEVTVNAGQINGTYGGSAGNLQSHLNTVKNSIDSVTSRANDNANRLTKLETKVPTVKVGDIISTFQDSGNQYTVGGVIYLYIGQTRTVQHSTYPQLASALGISGATNYQLPVISDTSFTFDNGQRRRNRKHYIVAHVSS